MPKKKPISGAALPPGPANPSFGLAELLVNQSPQVRLLMSKIRALQQPGMTFSEVFQLAQVKYRADFQALLDKTRAVVPAQQNIGPPPHSRELYGRVADGASVFDIGSGDGRRVKEHSGRIKITAVDPQLSADKVSVVHVKCAVQEVLEEDVVYTSFNSLCQIENNSELFENLDGIHVVPDHDWLVAHGQACTVSEPAEMFSVKAQGRDYLDYPVKLPAAPIITSPGYKLCCGFKPRQANISFPLSMSEPSKWDVDLDLTAQSCCTPGNEVNLNLSDLGHKWDGVFYSLCISDKVAYLADRAGRYQVSTTPVDAPDCELHIEYLQAPHPCFVLLRIIYYNNFVPPHSGDVLRAFASKVRLSIDGHPLHGPVRHSDPPVLGGCVYPTDGVISRDCGFDYYYKYDWTIDVKPKMLDKIKDECVELGLAYVAPETMPQTLSEYRILKRDGVVSLIFNRERPDKTRGTTIESVRNLLSLPTIDELMLLYEIKL